MSLAEEIKRVLLENPDILVEVIVSKPEIIYEALARTLPWQNLATKQDVEETRKALKQDIEEAKRALKQDIEETTRALRQDIEEVKRAQEELRREIRQISTKLDALGARWGVLSEDAFREGVRELLREAGYAVEKWLYYDGDGYVYGYPSEVELDVVVRDGVTIAVEITSGLKRGDLITVKRKAELYAKTTGKPISATLVITPYINDRNPAYVKAMAERIGIKIITPGEPP
ncbi:putative conserved protein containing a coiled-coil domain [Pyrobaculum oguniense TE7]|uniref:Conserved protein containing a coiled-coil domain n=1 Tax=Pyrobaculum oguniense (strain DSM 13380 / JCM 10595 / TE7) TaxID=698757 RepID=H6QCQ7_PYROT|nr:putative conserved protein containing a coiled-coil domain [Pyrobaculum oguniense TE7]